MQDYSDLKEQWKFQETADGFCYIELYTSIGDEATKPLYNILYFDEDCNLQVYVPFCGNLVDIISKVQLFTLGGYDGDSYEQLFDKYESYLFSKYEEWMIEDSEFCEVLLLDCIGKEYGIDGVLPDLSTVEEDSYFEDVFGCYFFDMFDINIDLCREDINSNVALV